MQSAPIPAAPIPLTTGATYGVETFVGIPLLTLILGIVYSFIVYSVNFEPLFVGPLFVVYLSVLMPAKAITIKKGITKYSTILAVSALAIFLFFLGHYATRAYLTYQDFLKEEILYEKQEDIYVSDADAELFLNDALLTEVGYSGYIGSLLWYLRNTEITDTDGSNAKAVGFLESVGIEFFSMVISFGYVLLVLPNEIRLGREKIGEKKLPETAN